MAKIPVVSKFEISESFLGGYSVKYKCPHCQADLKSKQSEIGVATKCPKCGNAYGISRKASGEIERLETAKQLEAERRKQENSCQSCGEPLTFLTRVAGPTSEKICLACSVKQQEELEQRRKLEWQDANERRESSLKSIIVTTTPLLDGYRIVDYLGIDGVEVTVGTGVFADLSSGVSDFLGKRSRMMESKLRTARLEAIQLLKSLAFEREADAVISVDFDYSTFGHNQFAIIASGTLVRIESTTDTSSSPAIDESDW